MRSLSLLNCSGGALKNIVLIWFNLVWFGVFCPTHIPIMQDPLKHFDVIDAIAGRSARKVLAGAYTIPYTDVLTSAVSHGRVQIHVLAKHVTKPPLSLTNKTNPNGRRGRIRDFRKQGGRVTV